MYLSIRVVNIGNSKQQKLLDFIGELEDVLKIKAKKNYLKLQKGDVQDPLSDTSYLQKLTKKKQKPGSNRTVIKAASKKFSK